MRSWSGPHEIHPCMRAAPRPPEAIEPRLEKFTASEPGLLSGCFTIGSSAKRFALSERGFEL